MLIMVGLGVVLGTASVVLSLVLNSVLPFAVWAGALALAIIWHEKKVNPWS